MMRKATQDEISRIRMCNARIRNENHLLRCTLRNISADPYSECTKVLSNVIEHCTKKKYEPKSGGPDCPQFCPEPCRSPKPCPPKYKPRSCCVPSPCYPCCPDPSCIPQKRCPPKYKPKSCLVTSQCLSRSPPSACRPKPYCTCCITTRCCLSDCKPICCPKPVCCPKPKPSCLPPNPCGFYMRPRSRSPCSYSSRSHSSSSIRQPAPCRPRCPSHGPPCKCCSPTRPPSPCRPKTATRSCHTCPPFPRNFCSNNEQVEETSVSNNNMATTWYENDSASTHRPSSKILGELAFQLERRILDYVFGVEGSRQRRFYGYTVNNICQMMSKECKNMCGVDDPIRKSELAFRLKKLLIGLKKVGYDIKVHGDFAQQMVNNYGLLPCPPDACTIEQFGLHSVNCISCLIEQLATDEYEHNNLYILLQSLQYLSKCDRRPLFVW